METKNIPFNVSFDIDREFIISPCRYNITNCVRIKSTHLLLLHEKRLSYILHTKGEKKTSFKTQESCASIVISADIHSVFNDNGKRIMSDPNQFQKDAIVVLQKQGALPFLSFASFPSIIHTDYMQDIQLI